MGLGGLRGLMALVVLVVLMVMALLGQALGAAAGAATPRAAAEGGTAGTGEASDIGHVVVVGVPGLRWDHLDGIVTPTIFAGGDTGGVGLLSVRAARSLTCPSDGWLTLSAGNRARGVSKAGASCQSYFPYITPVPSESGGAVIPEMGLIVDDNSTLNHGAIPGLLAESLPCVAGVAPGGALAAADTRGVVDLYAPVLPSEDGALAGLLAACPATVVAAEQLVSMPPGLNDALAEIDQVVARVDAARPADSVLLVVGVSEVGLQEQHLHVVTARGPSYDPETWLLSPSTSRTPYTQLIDVAPTVLGLLGVEKPSAMSGQAFASVEDREQPLSEDRDWMIDQDLMNRTHYQTVDYWWGVLTGFVIVFCLLAAAMTVAATRHDRAGRTDSARRLRRGLEITALSAASVQLATFLSQLLPWWRQIIPAGFYATWVVIWVGLLVTVALVMPWRWGPLRRYLVLGPAGVVAAVTAVVLAYDVMTTSDLEFGSINGYNAIVAGRFVGFGNTGFAIYATALLLALGILTHRWSRWPAVITIAVGGMLGTAVVANPSWGNDFGGTITLFAAVGVMVLLNLGIRLTWWKVLLVLGAAGAAALFVAYLDYLNPPEERTHFGRFMEDLLSGEALTVIVRKLSNNIELFLTSPLTFTIPAALLFAWFVLRRPDSGVPQATRLSPRLRTAVIAVVVCGVIGSLVNDSSVAIAALTIATVIPLLVAVGMRQIDPAWGASPADRLPSEPGSGEHDEAGEPDNGDEAPEADAGGEPTGVGSQADEDGTGGQRGRGSTPAGVESP